MREINSQNYFENTENVHIHQHASKFKEYLFVIVLTHTQQYWANNPSVIVDVPTGNYGNTLKHWKPFGEATISGLLDEFSRLSEINLKVCYLDESCINHAIRRQAKGLKDRIVLVADPFSLVATNNNQFAKVFDETAHNNIKACLVPLCVTSSTRARGIATNNIKGTFEDLYHGWGQEFFKSYVHIELDVPSKIHFFRRLSNIAFYRGIGDKENLARFEATTQKFENKPSLGDL
ncbi:hypothetical protein [uncultured Microscilla sp.]|uniref:hypothetical protein n=1 Tax=uncultured Microscilla sp. TaxID=432653 RepID=UPI0026215873|nr:hypothetical protein [uncultured Microscilla sp.]